jgi:lipopolysaccharide exporter
MDAIGKPQLNFKVNFIFFCISLILHLVFISTIGGFGGAIAISILYVLMFVTMIVLLKKHIGVSPTGIIQSTRVAYQQFFSMIRPGKPLK